MRLKLDENLGRRCAFELEAAGHDVATVFGQGLVSIPDKQLVDVCRDEGRALVTLELDFNNPLVFNPSEYPGIAVLRIPRKPVHADLLGAIGTLVRALERRSLPP